MKNNFKIGSPDGADDLFGFGFYKDVTPTAFENGLGAQSETASATSPLTGFLN